MEKENNSTAHTREALVNDVGNLKRDVTKVVRDVKQHAEAHVEATKERVNDGLEMLREFLAAQPLALLGVGFLLGLLVGMGRRK